MATADTILTRVEDYVTPMGALAVAVVAVSTSAILVRWSTAPSSVVAFYRVLLTTVLLAPLVVTRHAGSLTKLSGRDLLVAGAAGVALAVHFATWFESLEWTSVAASVTLVQAQPLFVALGAWVLLDERITHRTAIGIGIAVAGMAVMSVGDFLSGTAVGPRPLFGNSLAVLAAVMMALYVLVGRSLRQRLPLLPYVTVVYLVAAATLLVFLLGQGHPLAGYPPREWLLFLAMAAGPGVFGHTVLNWALAHVDSSVVSVSLLGEPLGSALLALILLAEIPTLWTVVGGAIVLGGITLTARAGGGAAE
jgi:drug/metabolite transporter (DMT)-like permease